mmetsp:Transcript_38365/g.62182  ORF Transcript_38365/g.62182 Transcript_38365/m.62182 type:complete len:106 (+) Transcript_38365:385-702(+)
MQFILTYSSCIIFFLYQRFALEWDEVVSSLPFDKQEECGPHAHTPHLRRRACNRHRNLHFILVFIAVTATAVLLAMAAILGPGMILGHCPTDPSANSIFAVGSAG